MKIANSHETWLVVLDGTPWPMSISESCWFLPWTITHRRGIVNEWVCLLPVICLCQSILQALLKRTDFIKGINSASWTARQKWITWGNRRASMENVVAWTKNWLSRDRTIIILQYPFCCQKSQALAHEKIPSQFARTYERPRICTSQGFKSHAKSISTWIVRNSVAENAC